MNLKEYKAADQILDAFNVTGFWLGKASNPEFFLKSWFVNSIVRCYKWSETFLTARWDLNGLAYAMFTECWGPGRSFSSPVEAILERINKKLKNVALWVVINFPALNSDDHIEGLRNPRNGWGMKRRSILCFWSDLLEERRTKWNIRAYLWCVAIPQCTGRSFWGCLTTYQ